MGHSPGVKLTMPLKSPRCIGCTSNLYGSFLFGRIMSFLGPLMNGLLEDTLKKDQTLQKANVESTYWEIDLRKNKSSYLSCWVWRARAGFWNKKVFSLSL